MYILCSPCILSPSLRAKGITHPSDIAAFARSIGRCKKFGIDVVSLPCPETLYLGNDRQPGTFLERLNTPEFASILENLSQQVNAIIEERWTTPLYTWCELLTDMRGNQYILWR